MPDVNLNGITLHYEVDGTGPPLLLLAGMLSDSSTWAAFTPLITDHFTVIRPDNRTTGQTVLGDAPADVHLMAQDAVALMKHLDHDTYYVAGHSLGGLLALEVAQMNTGNIAGIGVIASGRRRMARTAAVFDALLAIRNAQGGEELWLRALYPWVFGQAFFETSDNIQMALDAALAYPHAQTLENMTRQIAAYRAFRPTPDLSQITAPTLTVFAGQDLLVPPDLVRASFSDLPNLTDVTIPDAGHSVIWDAPQETARHLTDFLTSHPIS